METRAHYALIGTFTIAIVMAAFGFVYWFSGAERTGEQKVYKVIFSGSISGLSDHGVVLFNGVRIGEVTKIGLMPQDPSQVYALIRVAENAPVRTDTQARLEYTGFTGVASVALSGGATSAPPLPTSPQNPGIIHAERSEFQDLIVLARQVATAMADVGETVKPLTAHLDTLASDADKVVKAIDPEDVKKIVADFVSLSAKLDKAADKADGVLTNLNGFLGTGNSKGAFGEIAEAAKSIRKAANDFDSQMKQIAANINRFSGSGLRQYEALAIDGRKTLNELSDTLRSIEKDPQQFIFGKSSQVPEYSGAR